MFIKDTFDYLYQLGVIFSLVTWSLFGVIDLIIKNTVKSKVGGVILSVIILLVLLTPFYLGYERLAKSYMNEKLCEYYSICQDTVQNSETKNQ